MHGDSFSRSTPNNPDLLRNCISNLFYSPSCLLTSAPNPCFVLPTSRLARRCFRSSGVISCLHLLIPTFPHLPLIPSIYLNSRHKTDPSRYLTLGFSFSTSEPGNIRSEYPEPQSFLLRCRGSCTTLSHRYRSPGTTSPQ